MPTMLTSLHVLSSGTIHGIDTPLSDLEVFRSKQENAPRRPFRNPHSQLSIDRETWNKIEKPHQALWDQFPPQRQEHDP